MAQDQLVVGYVRWDPAEAGPGPGGTALFSFSDVQGTLLWQAGVAAERPVSAGRILADQLGRRTALAVVNTGADSDRLILTLRTADGGEFAEIRRDFQPGQQFALFVDELFPNLPAGFVGSLSFAGEKGDARWAAVTLRQSSNQFGQPIFATLPVAALQGPAADKLVFPQIGAGSGLSTQVILINPFGQELRGRIRLISSAGVPLALTLGTQTASTFDYVVPPQGIFRGQFTLAAGIGAGYAVVELDQGPGLPAGSAVFQFTAGPATITEAGVLAADLSRRVRVYADQAGTRTGVAVAVPEAPAATVHFRLLDRVGRVLKTTERVLPAAGHLSIFVDELFPGLPFGFTGALEMECAEPMAAVTLKLTTNRLGNSVLTTLPVVDVETPPQSGTRYFPQFGFGSGFGTRLILVDPASAGGSAGQLSFWKQDGEELEVPLGGESRHSFDLELSGGSLRQLFPGVTAGIAEILVDPVVLTINQGSRRPLNPITLDQEGNPRDDFALTFQSLNTATIAVDSEGVMDALNRGFTTILIGGDGLLRSFTVVSGTISAGVPGFRPTDVAQDFAGQVFLAGGADHAVLRADGFESQAGLYAGALQQPGLANGPRLQSRFNRPSFLALDLSTGGDLYVSDAANHQIRRVQAGAGGEVETFSGTGQAGSQNGPAAQARFNNPQGVAIDDRGYLWVADSGNHTIRRIELASGQVTTVAGSPGLTGFVDGAGAQARFATPRGLLFEAETLTQQLIREQTGAPPPPVTVLVADSGNGAVRRVWEDGRVETLGSSNLAKSAGLDEQRFRSAHRFGFDRPVGLALDPFGNLYVSEEVTGEVKVALGNGDVVLAAEQGTFSDPGGMAITIRGRVLVAESGSSVQQIRYAGPTLTSVAPQTVPTGAGSQVTLTGQNFAPESIVLVGNRVAAVEFVDTTELHVTTPELESGRQTVTVFHRGGLAQGVLDVTPPAPEELSSGDITTLVGGTTYVGDGLLATSAVLRSPSGLAVASSGDLWLADSGQHRIRRVVAVAGIISTVAGVGAPGDSGPDTPAVLASLNAPSAVAHDAEGNLYLVDALNHKVRMLEAATGLLRDVMGDGSPGFSGDGGDALDARLRNPAGIAVAADGRVWVSDQGNHRVRRIDPVTGLVTTVAGTGQAGALGDHGPAVHAQLNSPAGLEFGTDGTLYVADRDNHRIRAIGPDGVIRTVAGDGQAGFGGDGGPGAEARLNQPRDVALDQNGGLLIADSLNHRLRRVQLDSGTIVTVAGNGVAAYSGDGGNAVSASLQLPSGVVVDGTGNLLVADTFNRRVRRIDVITGVISTAAGSGADFAGDGGPPHLAALESPAGLALTGGGLVIAEETGHRIRFTGFAGSGTTVAQAAAPVIVTLAGDGVPGDLDSPVDPLAARFSGPSGVVPGAPGEVLVADSGNHKLRRVTPDGVSTLAGTGEPGYFDDVPAVLARFWNPADIIVDPQGGYLIADTRNHRIRRLDPQGFVSLVAGTGAAGGGGDGDQPNRAQLNEPTAMVVDDEGRIYFCDSGNHRIRVIDRIGRQITTLAGTGDAGFGGDGGPAAAARLHAPSGLALSASGLLFVADSGNHRIRVIDLSSGTIETVAGTGTAGYSGDGGSGISAQLRRPGRLLLDGLGNLLISDQGNQRVRLLRAVGGE